VKFPGSLLKRTIVGALVLLAAAGVYLYNTMDISSQAVRYRLEALGASIYEYQAAAGHWPDKAADLAGTSMAMRLRYWQDDIKTGRVVVLWPQNLKPHPQDNADRILAYYNRGLISTLGNWVCWGDLRTEYLRTEKLQAVLKGQ
jgi:hypothetical protein